MEQGNGQPAGEGTAENGSANFEMDLYTLQFKWIPSLIDAVVKGNLPCQALADVPWWEKCQVPDCQTMADFEREVDRPCDVDRPYERPTPERARVVWRCV